jgi:hypothetical protein
MIFLVISLSDRVWLISRAATKMLVSDGASGLDGLGYDWLPQVSRRKGFQHRFCGSLNGDSDAVFRHGMVEGSSRCIVFSELSCREEAQSNAVSSQENLTRAIRFGQSAADPAREGALSERAPRQVARADRGQSTRAGRLKAIMATSAR